MFNIDWAKYELVDLSMPIVPNQTNLGRPFEIREGRLGDGTLKYDIVNTHTHVGTHIESPVHFYFQGKTCTDFPLEQFMGRAALVTADIPDSVSSVSLEHVRSQVEPKRDTVEIVYLRNDSSRTPLFVDLDCVRYLAEFNLKLFIFDHTIIFGDTSIEAGRVFHDLLLSRDTLLVEFPSNGIALRKPDFYVFAVPLRVQAIDSSGCRLFAVVER